MSVENPKLKYLEDVPWEKLLKLSNGKIVHSLEQLPVVIQFSDDEVFLGHTSSQGNDFSNWIRDVIGYPELADKITGIREKEEFIRCITQAIIDIKNYTPPQAAVSAADNNTVLSSNINSSPVPPLAPVVSPVSSSVVDINKSDNKNPVATNTTPATPEKSAFPVSNQTSPVGTTAVNPSDTATASVPSSSPISSPVSPAVSSPVSPAVSSPVSPAVSSPFSPAVSSPFSPAVSSPVPSDVLSVNSEIVSEAKISPQASSESNPGSSSIAGLSNSVSVSDVKEETLSKNSADVKVSVDVKQDAISDDTKTSIASTVPENSSGLSSSEVKPIGASSEELYEFEEVFKTLLDDIENDVFVWDTQSG
ncbi:MAG: hypothetical protein ACP5OA_01235 [Candidatus Woesearchaeota archaeon]